jgi:hypothetical protein
MKSAFEQLSSINVNDHIEKKNGLSYLSWVWAVDQLLRNDPDASWSYGEPKPYADTVMVFCTVQAFGRERTAQLPVMDHKNRAIPNPDAFQVNTAMQRALCKAIALHGLGLYIYAGEDLPEVDKTDIAPRQENGEKTEKPARVQEGPVAQPKQAATARINEAQLAKIRALLAESQTTLQRFLAFFRIDALPDLPASEFERAIQTLERAKQRAA